MSDRDLAWILLMLESCDLILLYIAQDDKVGMIYLLVLNAEYRVSFCILFNNNVRLKTLFFFSLGMH